MPLTGDTAEVAADKSDQRVLLRFKCASLIKIGNTPPRSHSSLRLSLSLTVSAISAAPQTSVELIAGTANGARSSQQLANLLTHSAIGIIY